MEDRLQQALAFANYKQTLNNQLHKIKIKAEGQLMFAEAGGKFTINPELICFFDYLIRTGLKEATVLDDNKSPILITDTEEFLKKITARYFEVTNDYLQEAKIIKKSRDVKSILSLKVDE